MSYSSFSSVLSMSPSQLCNIFLFFKAKHPLLVENHITYLCETKTYLSLGLWANNHNYTHICMHTPWLCVYNLHPTRGLSPWTKPRGQGEVLRSLLLIPTIHLCQTLFACDWGRSLVVKCTVCFLRGAWFQESGVIV